MVVVHWLASHINFARSYRKSGDCYDDTTAVARLPYVYDGVLYGTVATVHSTVCEL